MITADDGLGGCMFTHGVDQTCRIGCPFFSASNQLLQVVDPWVIRRGAAGLFQGLLRTAGVSGGHPSGKLQLRLSPNALGFFCCPFDIGFCAQCLFFGKKYDFRKAGALTSPDRRGILTNFGGPSGIRTPDQGI
jgi:hypothetical protein